MVACSVNFVVVGDPMTTVVMTLAASITSLVTCCFFGYHVCNVAGYTKVGNFVGNFVGNVVGNVLSNLVDICCRECW